MAAQPSSEAVTAPADEAAVYKQLDEYNWDADTEFQSGLQAILGSTADPARAEHLTLRARCFYLSRYVSQALCAFSREFCELKSGGGKKGGKMKR